MGSLKQELKQLKTALLNAGNSFNDVSDFDPFDTHINYVAKHIMRLLIYYDIKRILEGQFGNDIVYFSWDSSFPNTSTSPVNYADQINDIRMMRDGIDITEKHKRDPEYPEKLKMIADDWMSYIDDHYLEALGICEWERKE